MRSSKQRSRSKPNRNRSVGNIVNRVFDSSGPESKVRGTPQQIIDKYNQLARDAQLSNDRVATENFQQHAEHYTRMLGEAQREADTRREAQEAQQQANNHTPPGQQPGQQPGNGQDRNRDDGRDGRGQRDNRGPRAERPPRDASDPAQDAAVQDQPSRSGTDDQSAPAPGQNAQPSAERAPSDSARPEQGSETDPVIDIGRDTESGLVETPENKTDEKPKRKPRGPRKPRAAKPAPVDQSEQSGQVSEDPLPDNAAE